MKTIAIKPPCKKEVARDNELNNISLADASKEIPKMIAQSKKEYNDRKN